MVNQSYTQAYLRRKGMLVKSWNIPFRLYPNAKQYLYLYPSIERTVGFALKALNEHPGRSQEE